MNNYERTEDLIRKKPRRRVDRRHVWLTWILGAVLVLLIAGIGYYVYTNYQDTKYEKELNLGNKYLKKKDYKKAKIAYQKATKIRKRRPEAHERLAQCALYTNDYPLARESWWYLYDLTHSPFYRRNARLVSYGNSNGNLCNGGNIAQYGCTTYISQMEDNSMNRFYRINEYSTYNTDNSQYTSVDRSETYLDRSTNDNSTNNIDNSSAQIAEIPSAKPNEPVRDLNAYGENLYYINGGKVYVYNTTTGETGEVPDTPDNVSKLMLYDDKIITQTPTADGKTQVESRDMDGKNAETLHTGEGKNNDFIIEDGKLIVTENQDSGAKISQVGLEDKQSEELVTEKDKAVDTLIYNDNDGKMYYNCKNKDGSYDDSIYSLNPEEKSSEVYSSPGKVSSINQDGENLFYVSNDKVYESGFNGGEGTEIGDVPKENVQDPLSSLGTSSANLFVTASDPAGSDGGNLGDNMKINAAPLEDPEIYNPFNTQLLNIEDEIVEDPEDAELTEEETNETIDEDSVDVEDSGGEENVDVDDSSTDVIDDDPLRVVYD